MAKSYQDNQEALSAFLNMRYDKLQAKINALQQRLPSQRISSEKESTASAHSAYSSGNTNEKPQQISWRFGNEPTLQSVIQGSLENMIIAKQILDWDWGLEKPVHKDSQEISEYFAKQVNLDLDEPEFQDLLLQTESSLLDEVFAVKASKKMAEPAMSNLLRSIHDTEWKKELQTIYEPFENLEPDQVRIDIPTTLQLLEKLMNNAQSMDNNAKQAAMRILDAVSEKLIGIHETMTELKHNAFVVRSARMAEVRAVERSSIERIVNLMKLSKATTKDFMDIAEEVTTYYSRPGEVVGKQFNPITTELLTRVQQAQKEQIDPGRHEPDKETLAPQSEKKSGYAQSYYPSDSGSYYPSDSGSPNSGYFSTRSVTSMQGNFATNDDDATSYFTASGQSKSVSHKNRSTQAPYPIINVDDGVSINAAELPIQRADTAKQSSEASYKTAKSVASSSVSRRKDKTPEEPWLPDSNKRSDEFLEQYVRKNPHLSELADNIASKNLQRAAVKQNIVSSAKQQGHKNKPSGPSSSIISGVSKIQPSKNETKTKKI